jgi:hypothetical protein
MRRSDGGLLAARDHNGVLQENSAVLKPFQEVRVTLRSCDVPQIAEYTPFVVRFESGRTIGVRARLLCSLAPSVLRSSEDTS